MRKLFVVGAVTGALATAGSAGAGCFATAGLSLPPEGVAAGEPWTAKLTVLQHGVTPMPDARPEVVIENEKTGERRRFAARRVDGQGSYAARVVFPSRGSWKLAVFDGFAVGGYPARACQQTHTFGSITVGGKPTGATSLNGTSGTSQPAPLAAAPSSDSRWTLVWALVVAGGIGLAAAGAGMALARRGERRSAAPR